MINLHQNKLKIKKNIFIYFINNKLNYLQTKNFSKSKIIIENNYNNKYKNIIIYKENKNNDSFIEINNTNSNIIPKFQIKKNVILLYYLLFII